MSERDRCLQAELVRLRNPLSRIALAVHESAAHARPVLEAVREIDERIEEMLRGLSPPARDCAEDDFARCISASTRRLAPVFDARGVDVRTRTPAAGLACDPTLIRRVLHRLVLCAGRWMRARQGEVEIEGFVRGSEMGVRMDVRLESGRHDDAERPDLLGPIRSLALSDGLSLEGRARAQSGYVIVSWPEATGR